MAGHALLIIGAPGAGKSALLDALSTRLEINDVTFGAVECDELSRGWPYPPLDEALPRLATVTDLQRQAGRSLLLVVATPETRGELDAVIDAINAEHTLVLCLRAPANVVAARVEAREPDRWPGKRPLINHARELADTIPTLGAINAVLDSSQRPVEELASEVLGLLKDWVSR